jgi:hypothetical protein
MAKQGEWVVCWPDGSSDPFLRDSRLQIWTNSFTKAEGYSSQEEAQKICDKWENDKPVPGLFNPLNLWKTDILL